MEQKKDLKTASLTACVAHVLGVDTSEVPGDGGVRLNQWLAGRNLGLVPVESPQSFKWPGRFLGLRSRSSTWAVFFGVPPGVVYDPAAETDGRSPGEPPRGTDVALEAAFVMAEHDPLREIGSGLDPGRKSESSGTVEVIALAAEAEGPMKVVPSAEAVENRGLVHRGGLRADVLSSGEIHAGDSVEALP